MTRKQELKNDVFRGISKIENLDSSKNIEVKKIYSILTKKISKLKRYDFNNQFHYELFFKTFKVRKEMYLFELKALDIGEEYAISENYIQIRLSIIRYLTWLEDDY